jgi:hypothetical protein
VHAKLPKTLGEAVDQVLEKMSPEVKEMLRGTKKEDLSRTIVDRHFGLGRAIRNGVSAWNNQELLRSCVEEKAREIEDRLAHPATLTEKERSFLETKRGYYDKCKEDMAYFHPDGTSGIILEAVWKRLQEAGESP